MINFYLSVLLVDHYYYLQIAVLMFATVKSVTRGRKRERVIEGEGVREGVSGHVMFRFKVVEYAVLVEVLNL